VAYEQEPGRFPLIILDQL